MSFLPLFNITDEQQMYCTLIIENTIKMNNLSKTDIIEDKCPFLKAALVRLPAKRDICHNGR
jgi:hypothetical protein